MGPTGQLQPVAIPSVVAHLISTGLQEYDFGLSESCHGDGLDSMRGVQASPGGRETGREVRCS